MKQSKQMDFRGRLFALGRRWKARLRLVLGAILDRSFRTSYFIYRIEGSIGESPEKCTLLIAGSERIADAYHSFFFARQGQLQKITQISGFGLRSSLQKALKADDDILLWEAWPWEKRQKPGVFALEAWSTARMYLLGDEPDVFLKREASSTMLRRLKSYSKNPCTLEEYEDEASLDLFYHDFYRPLLERRHGQNAHSSSLALMHSFGGRTVRKYVVFLHRGGQRVAGILLLHDTLEDCVTIQEYGVAAAYLDDAKVFQELYAGLNYTALVWAAQRSVSVVSMGGAPNHLQNGVYYYKKQWGANFERNREREAVCLEFISTKKLNILTHFSLLCFEGEQPFGLLAHQTIQTSAHTQESLEQRLKAYSSRNVRRFHVFVPEGSEALESSKDLEKVEIVYLKA